MKRRVAVFGSTGSIGRSTLDVLARLSDRFTVTALAAARSVDLLSRQAARFRPRHVLVTDEAARRLAACRLGRRAGSGPDALTAVAGSPDVDILVMAMSGTDGLGPVLAALRQGKRVAIATKEILVGYGEPVLAAARRSGAELLPVDSELAALHQCLDGRPAHSVRRVVLTASGGPFRLTGPPADATVADVLRHPTWKMGPKITVDSATLMNKGLEVIETARLFGLAPDQVETVIHPQSIVHSLVELWDGSVLAHLSQPDMRLPIQYCLTYPERVPSPVHRLSLHEVGLLEFHRPDHGRFPCLGLAYRALRSGPSAPCVLNAANQVAVEAFLAGRIAFGTIPRIIKSTLGTLARGASGRRAGLWRLRRAAADAAALAQRLVLRLGSGRQPER